MQMDTFFSMGKSHKVCEDYALHGKTLPMNIFGISDGCSSSIDTDFGSRILMKSLMMAFTDNKERYAGDIKWIWDKAMHVTHALGLDKACLDATMNFGYVVEINGVRGIEVITIGDGFVVAQDNSGEFSIMEIDFSQNAPYYLSYEFDSDRKQQLMKLKQEKHVTVKCYDFQSCAIQDSFTSTIPENIAVDKFTRSWFPLEVYKSVSVFSDGLKTFLPHDQTQPRVPLEQIVKELISFPQTNGDFVKRRCLKFMKNHVESSFYDDFSMATLVRD